MTLEEWNKKKHKIVVLKEGIHTEVDLCNFMADEQTTRDPYENVQYRFFCIPDYQEDKSAIVVKFHHCFADAVSMSTLFQVFSDNFDPSNFPPQRNVPFGVWAFIYATLPFTIIYEGVKQIFTARDYNCLTQ